MAWTKHREQITWLPVCTASSQCATADETDGAFCSQWHGELVTSKSWRVPCACLGTQTPQTDGGQTMFSSARPQPT